MDLNKDLNKKEFKYIDALRGYAIIAVIIVHISHTEGLKLTETFLKIVTQGARGVQLFFIVSSLTLFMSYELRSKVELNPVRNFFIRRFFRIAPMYYLAIIYYIFQNNLIPNSTQGVLLNTFFLHGFSVNWINTIVPGGWSIGVEMMFYCCLPFFFTRITNLKSAINFLLVSLILKGFVEFSIKLLVEQTNVEMFNNFLFFYLPSQLPIFALGAILYQLLKSGIEEIKEITNSQIMIFLIFLFYYLITRDQIFINDNLLFGIGFLVFALLMSRSNSKLLINSYICLIGKVSYSLYLVHFIVIYWLGQKYFFLYFNNGIIDYFFRLIMVISIGTIISFALNKLIELPFQTLSKTIINKLKK